jgi:CPA1 family monovalent cation:H+ antiporter
VVASLSLPILFRDLNLPPDEPSEREEIAARVKAAQAAIRAVERAMATAPADVALAAEASVRVLDYYRHRADLGMANLEEAESSRRLHLVERRLFMAGLRAEREEIVRLGHARSLGSEAMRKLSRETNLMEARVGE